MSSLSKTADLIERLAWAHSADDTCRILVHSDFFGSPFHGAALATLDRGAELHEIGRYGIPGRPEDFRGLSIFATTRLAQTVVSGEPRLINDPHINPVHNQSNFDWDKAKPFPTVLMLPLTHDGVPFGLLSLLSKDRFDSVDVGPEAWRLLTASLTLFIRSQNRIGSYEVLGAPGPSQLSSRQLTIASLIADGRANKEISGEINVSLATVKLEVQRILKTLGVANRTEVAAALSHNSTQVE